MGSTNKILSHLQSVSNFKKEHFKFNLLENRIQNRIANTGCINSDEYYKYLLETESEIKLLNDSFLINVSHFFRDSLYYEIIAHSVIPQLIINKIKQNNTSIRIWSAACATGEEPYSMAMLFDKIFKEENLSFDLKIFATDIDQTAIEQAKTGVYTADKLKETKYEFIESYFKRSSNNYHLKESIKEYVCFSTFDLVGETGYAPAESIFGNFDIVLCRNMLIYLTPQYYNIVFEKLYKSISQNGFLVMGIAETLPSEYMNSFKQLNNLVKIYKKGIQ